MTLRETAISVNICGNFKSAPCKVGAFRIRPKPNRECAVTRTVWGHRGVLLSLWKEGLSLWEWMRGQPPSAEVFFGGISVRFFRDASATWSSASMHSRTVNPDFR